MNFTDNKIKEEFNSNGYALIYSFFNEDKIQEIKNEIDRYINDVVPTLPNHHVFYEDKSDKSTIKNLQQMFNYDDYFKKLIEESSIQEVASFLLQEKAIPIILKKHDVLGSAQTGTGKTAAFALPILHHLINEANNHNKKKIKTLVITPTRELAIQIASKNFILHW